MRRNIRKPGCLKSAIIFALLACVSFSAKADDSGLFVRASKQEDMRSGLYILKIFIIVDKIRIQNITVNRGNCVINTVLPQNFKFGDTLDYEIGCNPIEVVVSSEDGNQTITWDH